MTRRIHFVSLGCSKNRVDSEVMLGLAERSGFEHTAQAEEAEVIVVNTCGFIEAARRESIDTILELGAHKTGGRCRKLVVTGCLSQAHSGELSEGLPEVDHFLGSSDMLKLEQVLRGTSQRILVGNPADWVISAASPRRLTTPGGSAYVKLAEGCNKHCAFCIIPELRGKQRSRPPEDVVREVEALAAQGVKEINLVSQDTIAYGRDLPAPVPLAEVVRRVADVSGIEWVRIFYLYPEKLDPALLELYREHPNVVAYLDMPLQHAADSMLRRMRRPTGADNLLRLFDSLRESIDDLFIRSAFIIGHPGETAEEFATLRSFLKRAAFDRLALFEYSDEESCHAHSLDGKVDPATTRARLDELSALQTGISRERNQRLVGRRLRVLVEGPSEEFEFVMTGRHAGQAPEIDGVVFLSGAEVAPGQMVEVDVEQATDFDLLGEVDPNFDLGDAGKRPPPGKRHLPTLN